MFRIILENEDKIHIEGFNLIKRFDTQHISVCTKKICIDIEGNNFAITELGNSDLIIIGKIISVKYTRINEEIN